MPHSSFSGFLFSSLLRSVALTLMLALMLGVFATAAAAGDKIIILDPGHGGADPGAIAPSGLQEKKVTLEFAKILKKAISKRKGYDALLTRTKDQWRSLNARMRFAKRHKADLFISIHVDSNPNHYVHGLTVYSLSQKAYKRYSARWARNKRKVSGNGAVLRGVDLTRTLPEVRSMLIDLVQHRNRDLSISLARSVLKKVKRATPPPRKTPSLRQFSSSLPPSDSLRAHRTGIPHQSR